MTQLWTPSNDNIVFSYDAGGRITGKQYGNGTLAAYAYNPDNTLKQLLNKTGTTVLSQHDYTYDGVGNRRTHAEKVGTADTGRTYLYGYDELNRLTEVRNNADNSLIAGYAYDAIDNRISKTEAGNTTYYVHDAASQLKEIRQGSTTGTLIATLQYDANGNLTNKTDSSTTATFSYNALNQLTQASKTGLPTETYGYDDSGRRIRKTIGTANSYYLYDGDDILAEYGNGWTTASASYTQAGGDTPLLRVAGSNVQFYHQDGLGSVIATTDRNGTVTATTRYDAWGNTVASSGSISQYGYTGREPDATGLMYYRARYYSPEIGRFTQRDPIGYAGGINPYAYVDGNPINYSDPTGLAKGLTLPGKSSDPLTAGQREFLDNSTASLELEDLAVLAPEKFARAAEYWGQRKEETGNSLYAIPQAVTGFIAENYNAVGAALTMGRGPVAKGTNKAPDFVVSPSGTVFPVPKGAQGPVPVINPGGKQTGVAYTGGSGGANNKVDTIRIMDPTPARGASPGYPNGYIKYENASGQGVNPTTGKTVPNTESHFPVQ